MFKEEKANIGGCDDQITSFALKKGLLAEHDLYCELTIAPNLTLEEVFATALHYMLWEDNRIVKKKFATQAEQSPKKAGQKGDNPGSRNYGGKCKALCQGGAPANEGYTKFTIPIHQILAYVKHKRSAKHMCMTQPTVDLGKCTSRSS